jgi:hypothetical protein
MRYEFLPSFPWHLQAFTASGSQAGPSVAGPTPPGATPASPER